ncbi:MAG: TPM domain-containing protein [Verrucomicrobiota bacterium]
MTLLRHACGRVLCFWLACLGLMFAAPTARAEVPASPSPHYVYDEARWLGPAAFAAIDKRLQDYERESSSQMLVAIFQALPESGEMVDFSQRVFDAWKPGEKGKDNSAILFFFVNERKIRIQVGYGLEGALPDARCKQIIEEVIAPRLRAENRELAVAAGIEAMIAATKGEYQGTGRTRLDRRDGIPWPVIILWVIFVLVVFSSQQHGDVVITRGGSRHGDWSRSSWGSGGGGGGGGWSGGGGFSGGGGRSGGGGASGGW